MAGAGEATKYPPSEFSQKYSKVLAPDGKLISPGEVFGEGKRFDKDVEEKTRLAFKVTLKKLEKMNIESEKNKANLEKERVDQRRGEAGRDQDQVVQTDQQDGASAAQSSGIHCGGREFEERREKSESRP